MDTITKDETKIKHVDEALKLLSAFTGDSRYEELIGSEDGEEVDSMCEIMDRATNRGRNEGQTELIALWNWLMSSGRNADAAAMMDPSNEALRKSLFEEYENFVQGEYEIL